MGTSWWLLGDCLRTTWGLLGNNFGLFGDYFENNSRTRRLGDRFLTIFHHLVATCWSFWNHFEATWCNLGHLVTAFLLSLAQLGPLDEYLITSSKLQLSEQAFSPCGQQLLFSSIVYCIYDFRIESIGRKYCTQIDLHNPWTPILFRIPSCVVGPSCDFESLLWIIKSCQAIYDIPECIPGLKDKKRAISKCKIYPISGIAHK